jgi:hypothetical protein
VGGGESCFLLPLLGIETGLQELTRIRVMKSRFTVIAFTLVLFQLVLNGQTNLPDAKTGKSAGDVVVVRIDGKDLTKSEVLRDGKVVLLLNMNKARKKNVRKREIKALEKYCRSAGARQIAKAAVERYMADRNVQIPDGTLARVTRRFESQYGAMSRKLRRRHKIDDLKYMLGKNAFRVDEMILETARFEAMTNDVLQSADIAVSDNEVASRLESIKRGNERAAAISQGVFAKATNVWQEIVSGVMTFEDAANKYSEDEYIKDGCEWGCFNRNQLEGEESLLALLPNLKVGDVTPPIESDGGVAILRKDEDDSDTTYSFSRVFFRLPYFYEEETPEQAQLALRARKGSELVKSAMDENIAKLTIEYPDGTNIVWTITQQDFK